MVCLQAHPSSPSGQWTKKNAINAAYTVHTPKTKSISSNYLAPPKHDRQRIRTTPPPPPGRTSDCILVCSSYYLVSYIHYTHILSYELVHYMTFFFPNRGMSLPSCARHFLCHPPLPPAEQRGPIRHVTDWCRIHRISSNGTNRTEEEESWSSDSHRTVIAQVLGGVLPPAEVSASHGLAVRPMGQQTRQRRL